MRYSKQANQVSLLVLFLTITLCPTAFAGVSCYARDSYSENLIMALQERLVKEGENPGPIDGRWGPATEKAIAAFQWSRNLNPAAGLNGATLRALFGDKFDPKSYGLEPNSYLPANIFKAHCR